MASLGKQWLQEVPPTWDKADPNGRYIYIEAQNRLEQQAKVLFERWQQHDVPARIKSCMKEGDQFHGFQTEAWLLNTEAFVRFKAWLNSEDLICNCGYPPADDPDLATGGNVILMIMPRTPECEI